MYIECSREDCLCRSCKFNYRNVANTVGDCMDCIDCDSETDSLFCDQCSEYENESEE